MYKLNVTIEGLAPILFNRWTDDAQQKLRSGATGGKFTDDQRLAEALEKTYTNDDGDLVIPGWNLKKCILEGSNRAGLKEGRAAMSKFLAATIFVEGDPSFGVTEPDFIDERMGRRPARTGGAVLIKRPGLRAGWRLPFTINVVDDRRDEAAIRRATEEAGLMVGLCDFRPEFGRFAIADWSRA